MAESPDFESGEDQSDSFEGREGSWSSARREVSNRETRQASLRRFGMRVVFDRSASAGRGPDGGAGHDDHGPAVPDDPAAGGCLAGAMYDRSEDRDQAAGRDLRARGADPALADCAARSDAGSVGTSGVGRPSSLGDRAAGSG